MPKEYMSNIVPDEFKKRAEELADNHIDWLFEMIRPIARAEFLHGFRHGWELSKQSYKKSKK